MKPVYTSRGEKKNPIHRHYWSDGTIKDSAYLKDREKDSAYLDDKEITAKVEKLFDKDSEKSNSLASNSDGQEMKYFRKLLSSKDFRKSLPPESPESPPYQMKLSDFSTIQGELFGHFYVTEVLGYEELFHGDNKANSMRQGLDAVYYDSSTKEIVVVELKGQNSPWDGEEKDPNWTIDRCQKIQKGEGRYIQATEAERKIATKILDAYDRGEKIRYEVVRTQVSQSNGKFWSQLEVQATLKKRLKENPDKTAVIDKLYSKSMQKSVDRKNESKSESKSESKKESKGEHKDG